MTLQRFTSLLTAWATLLIIMMGCSILLITTMAITGYACRVQWSGVIIEPCRAAPTATPTDPCTPHWLAGIECSDYPGCDRETSPMAGWTAPHYH